MVCMPADLGPRGKEFWKATTAEFEMGKEPHKQQLLGQACRVIDTIHTLALGMKDQPLMVPGSRPGQKVINPLIDQQRQQRALLSTLIHRLDLPADPGLEEDEQARQWRVDRAKKAANARWGRVG